MAAGRSRSVYKRLRGNSLSIVGLFLVFILLLVGVLAPQLSPYDPKEMMFEFVYHAPSRAFPFGTDALGRDLFSRILWGARTSLFVGVGAAFIGLMLGVVFGGLAGYYGGAVSQIFMRLADIELCIPQLILLIVAAAILAERGIVIITLIIGITMWPALARVTRSKVLELKTRDFVEAARASGASNTYILWKHILPNTLGPITVLTTLGVGTAIISEASLSFLGLGDPLMVSWGNILSTALDDVMHAPWMAVIPGIAIFLTVWGINMFGDALRDALDVEL